MFVVGGLAAILLGMIFRWRWTCHPRFRWLHLAAIMFVVARVWLGAPCPFSVGEDDLRSQITPPCPLGDPVYDVFHRLAFRGKNPQRFAWGTTLLGTVVLATILANEHARRRRAVAAVTSGTQTDCL